MTIVNRGPVKGLSHSAPVKITELSTEELTALVKEGKAPTRAALPAEAKPEIKPSAAAEILAMGRHMNKRDEAEKAVAEGWSVERFRNFLLDSMDGRPLVRPAMSGYSARDAREMSNFSLLKAARATVDGDWSEAGLEREVMRETARSMNNAGLKVQGLPVPTFALLGRASTFATGGSGNIDGGAFVGTDHRADAFIDRLRAATVIGQLGARTMGDLVGDVSIPRLAAGTAAAWVAEGSAATEGAPAFDSVTLSPKTLSANVSFTRQMMRQALPDIENTLRNDILQQIAVAVDAAAIAGTGSSNQPTGILNTSGIGSTTSLGTNGGAPTYAMLIELMREVAIDNALAGSLGFVTNPKVVAKLRQTAKQSSGVEGNFIMGEAETLFGYRVGVTTSVPSNLTKASGSNLSAMIFGNFNDLMIGEWGGADIIVDPYTLSKEGIIRMSVFSFVDIAVRNPESFAAAKDIVTT